MANTLILNVDELWLKGKNRPLYFRAIKEHLQEVLDHHQAGSYRLFCEGQRFIAVMQDDLAKEGGEFSAATVAHLLKVPGLHSLAPAVRVGLNLDEVLPALQHFLAGPPQTFKVLTKRANKSFPLNSVEIAAEIGHRILQQYPAWKVDVHHPQVLIELKVMPENIYVSWERQLGIGGQPWGMSGRGVALLSGGFDSPVAAYLMLKRGLQLDYAFFYAYPFVGTEVTKKIKELAAVLNQYQRQATLYIVPFGDLQKKIADICRPEYRTVLFRYYMLAASNLLAEKLDAPALVTGDALGQVSSQTLGNLALLDRLIPRLILRPVLGLNKAEIINLAEQIKTFEISVRPQDDACSLLAPRHPIIRPDEAYFTRFVQENPATDELNTALAQAEKIYFSLL
ncbi:MAG: tRNA 4-thiouridine(8) synthase ThiI [Bacteriovoracaceae bacterium]|nr:tRNA 4-thiouridine(8) synthase ThiI [Bacteriovoracaceae bacterium]